ncbi:MAG: hypothetical protein JWM68_3364 [Verrucomicrobiales bacterium]|nr:hypothetical protein [Verrucomicrobiales bacterium]
MNDLTDQQLLRAYAESDSEESFTFLVDRHVDLVYSAALRQVCDTHSAKDVTQAVFVALAQNAASLARHPVLSGWLHSTTRNLAAKTVRTNVRRQAREQEAAAMNELFAAEPAASWDDIAPHLDAALGELSQPDRDALLLRYFDKKSAREMAQILCISDEAAQKRVNRAMDRLREIFSKRRPALGASGLVALLSVNAVQSAPVGLAVTISATALASVGATSGVFTFLKLMTKLKSGMVGAVVLLGVIGAFLLTRESNGPNKSLASDVNKNAEDADSTIRSSTFRRGNSSRTQEAAPAEKIVADKVIQYGRKRRELVNAIARRLNTSVPSEINAFFDALEAGNWEETKSRWEFLATHTHQYERSKHDRPDLEPYWQAVLDAFLPAQEAHEWPAQKLLDYGNAILDSLRPDMVYVGGTDNGRSVPTLLNGTGGDAHIMLTQNALADGTYLDHLRELYGERFNTLSQEDSKRVFEEYSVDAQKRLQHDLDFPDEPKQVRPGENLKLIDGRLQASGATAVAAINEKLLQLLMQKNPNLSFAMQESSPLKGLYADAVPLGLLLELGAQDAQTTFTAERAGQSVDYWRTIAQNLLADPDAAGSTYTLKAYSHDVNSTANLLTAHNYFTEAEETYRLSSQLWPDNPDPVCGLAAILARTGRTDEARQMLDNFAVKYPDQRSAIETFRQSIPWTVSTAKPSP